MRLSTKKTLVTLAISFFAFPLWAAHIDTADWNADQAISIGGTQIKPGQYLLRAEEGKSELQVIQKGKIIATIPCQWIQLQSKPSNSQVQTDGGKVTQVQFGGRTSAVQFNP